MPSALQAPPTALAGVDHRSALRQAVAALDAAEHDARPYPMSEAHAQVAAAYAVLDALPAAACHLEQALRWAALTGSADLVAELQCELCELRVREAETTGGDDADAAAAAHAARERARDHAFAAASLAPRLADPQWSIKVLLRLSDALDRCGDHDDAASFQVRALELMSREPAAEADGGGFPTSLL